ncbi:SWI/SNF-related matrix-associated actin-dependent regulator of chromatin subfamily A-like protein 1 [Microplitis demolitor]|uniref:SWI/SNF-related matrix-associated actin-dependent regulator of chromatin subfamily A-like protein 1 n=1 Tax=Microplitis demolitor TaxID=69319 RepID=UPI0004CDD9A4|nr:SWI/SNF-related matrix-associated actin-dependent regulator of chromatin subfamily A-like protein 1 [Microplitis demolitor]
MTCSLQEIEEKRRQAIERRNARMQSLSKATSPPAPGQNKKITNYVTKNFIASTSKSQPTLTSFGVGLNRSTSSLSTNQNKSNNFLNKSYENQDLKRKNNSYPLSAPPSKLIKQINNNSINTINHSTASPTKVSPIDPNKFFNNQQIKGTISMISLTRFEVDIKYCPQFIEYCKTFKTRVYDQQRKLWSFDITEYNDFLKGLKDSAPQVQLAGLPQYVYRVFKNNASIKPEITEPDLSRIDPKLMETLMPFQREGVCFGIKKDGRCMIADDMGLGKTIQALGIAHYYKADWPLLIVAPSSVTHQWFQSILEFLPSVPVFDIVIFSRKQSYISDSKITIISYDLLMKNKDSIANTAFGTIILDESHTLKTLSAKKTEAVKKIVDKSKHIILLTGTPALSRPIELYSQITLIIPNFLTAHNYGVRYCNAEQTKFGWNYKGSSNTTELQLLLKSTCLIRRLKVDVLSQLPSKFRQIIMLDPNLIDEGTEEMKEAYKKCSQNKGNNHTTIIQCFNESSSQRIKAVCNYLEGVLEKEDKFIVFAHHKSILDAIMELLIRMNVKFIRIDGNTRAEDRKTLVDRFQERDNIRVAVLSITAANAGITLTAASLCIFAELYWNPGILCQAEDRIHRIGQNQSVIIRYLIAEKTVDDHLWPLLRTKLNFLTKAGLNQDFSLDNADVTKQIINGSPTSKQSKLDNFIAVASSQNLAESNKKVEENDKETKDAYNASTDVSDLMLDEDDEDLANIDLDMYQ